MVDPFLTLRKRFRHLEDLPPTESIKGLFSKTRALENDIEEYSMELPTFSENQLTLQATRCPMELQM